MEHYASESSILPDSAVDTSPKGHSNPSGGPGSVQDLDGDGTSFYQRFLGNAEFLGSCLNKKNYQPLKRRGDGDIGAGHVGRYISLANPDRASGFACHIPAIFCYSILFGFAFLYWLSLSAFFVCFMAMGVYVFGWTAYMCVSAMGGVLAMRRCTSQNWEAKWQDFLSANPGCDSGMLHFVILPNYAEDEDMLSQTIQVCADNSLAQKHMILVLAMEAREGEEGKAKAKALIDRHKHRFRAMFATFHPPSIPGEVKGKSSNTQWAFRDIQRWYGSYVSQNPDEAHDTSKVFITVADADSIFEKQYFTCLTVTALQKSIEERSWLVYQPPILSMRNIETVPAVIRCSGFGSFVFEVSGLFSSNIFDHLCFSSYSLSMALVNHPIVDGWDADVIAEDHHMFLKCLFASYWEELFSNETNRSVKNVSKLKIQPIWCPVTSYLVEENGEWWPSISARYVQARRHMQGIAELSYICLQHFTINQASREPLPWKTHLQLGHLALKYATIAIINNLYTLGLSIFVGLSTLYIMKRLLQGEIFEAFEEFQEARQEDSVFNALVFVVQWFMPLVTTVGVTTNFLAMKDTMEGRYCPVYLQNYHDEEKSAYQFEKEEYCTVVSDSFGSEREVPENSNGALNSASLAKLQGKGERVLKRRYFSFYGQMRLLAQVYTDLNVLGQMALFLFGSIPVLLQSVSLSRYGHKFDYVVAGKPLVAKKGETDTASVSTKIGSCSSTSSASDIEEELKEAAAQAV